MTNEEWLEHLAHNDIPGLRAWFKAEHVESPVSEALVQCAQIDGEGRERAAEDDTAAQDADSREQLEADAKRYIEHAADYAYEDVLWAGETFTLYDAIIELLDRQAAITEREYGERMASEAMCSNVCAVVCEQRGHIAELQVKVDELKAERERYREKFGKCIDYADAIHALMDDEGLA